MQLLNGPRTTKNDQNIIHFVVFKKKSDNFFSAISLQMNAKVHTYLRVRQCHYAYVIEQTFVVILPRGAPAASCQLFLLRLIKEK
jgi:hypothetical protein